MTDDSRNASQNKFTEFWVSLHCMVLESKLERALFVFNNTCRAADNAALGSKRPLFVWERAFASSKVNENVRVSCEVDELEDESTATTMYTSSDWLIEHQGPPLPSHKYPCSVRPVHRSVVQPDLRLSDMKTDASLPFSSAAESLMSFLGFKEEFEFVLKGWQFSNGRLEVRVFQIFKFASHGHLESVTPSQLLTTCEGKYVAEARMRCKGENVQQTVNELMKYTKTLEPYVTCFVDNSLLSTSIFNSEFHFFSLDPSKKQ